MYACTSLYRIGFLDHLNNIGESIKFTTEIEENNWIKFLDFSVQKDDGIPITKVYKKPTHTGKYLHYESNHHENTKLGVAKSLFDRARYICSSKQDKNKEFNNLMETLEQNGYPIRTIGMAIQASNGITQKNTNPTTSKCQNQSNNCIKKMTTVIPHIKRFSEKLEELVINTPTSFKNRNAVRSALTSVKPENENQKRKDFTYEIPCGTKFIGETKRPLKVRVKEHEKLTI